MRIGLVGYSSCPETGNLNWALATGVDIDVWLVKPHPRWGIGEIHEGVDTIICPNGGILMERFLRLVNIVLYVDKPCYRGLLERCMELGIAVVCIPLDKPIIESLELVRQGINNVKANRRLDSVRD